LFGGAFLFYLVHPAVEERDEGDEKDDAAGQDTDINGGAVPMKSGSLIWNPPWSQVRG